MSSIILLIYLNLYLCLSGGKHLLSVGLILEGILLVYFSQKILPFLVVMSIQYDSLT